MFLLRLGSLLSRRRLWGFLLMIALGSGIAIASFATELATEPTGEPIAEPIAPQLIPKLPSPSSPERLLPEPLPPALPPLDCSSVSDTASYGHLPYPEADRADLVSVGNDISLHRNAARDFDNMRQAAANVGIGLVPLSGFRSVAIQESLFYGIAAERGQTLAQRALVSAPPGHSEHHTGYAIDIGDRAAAWTDFNTSFEATEAGRWLLTYATEFGFELSFPPDHACVSYEPWHWRWVGDDRSREIFDSARRYDAQRQNASGD